MTSNPSRPFAATGFNNRDAGQTGLLLAQRMQAQRFIAIAEELLRYAAYVVESNILRYRFECMLTAIRQAGANVCS